MAPNTKFQYMTASKPVAKEETSHKQVSECYFSEKNYFKTNAYPQKIQVHSYRFDLH